LASQQLKIFNGARLAIEKPSEGSGAQNQSREAKDCILGIKPAI
jgi:hypothetical protein